MTRDIINPEIRSWMIHHLANQGEVYVENLLRSREERLARILDEKFDLILPREAALIQEARAALAIIRAKKDHE